MLRLTHRPISLSILSLWFGNLRSIKTIMLICKKNYKRPFFIGPANTMKDSCNAFTIKEIFPPLLLLSTFLSCHIMFTGWRTVSKTAYLRFWSVQEVRVNGRHVLCYSLYLNDNFRYRGSLVFSSIQGGFRSNMFCWRNCEPFSFQRSDFLHVTLI